MLTLESPEVKFAVSVVAEVSRLASRIQKELVTPSMTKSDRSPVTVADFAVQAVIGQRLAEAFSSATLVGEEDARELRQAAGQESLRHVTGYVGQLIADAEPQQVCNWIDYGCSDPDRKYWTVDPIDGTRGFLRGEQFATAFALIVEGQVQIGVLGCPNALPGGELRTGGSGSLLVAVAGGGAYVAPLDDPESRTQISVSSCRDPAELRVLGSYESAHTNDELMEALQKRMGIQAAPLRLDSQVKYALLAQGVGELLLRFPSSQKPDYKEKIWDHAAGALIVQEAGGQVTDVEGLALDFRQGRTLAENRGLLASNGALHQVALEAVRAVETPQ